MFELSGVNYEEVLEQGDSILVRVIASSSYRGFELSGLYCTLAPPQLSFPIFATIVVESLVRPWRMMINSKS